MRPADQLTVARMLAAPVIVALYVVDFSGHDYWATGLFAVAMATDWFDGWLARRSGPWSDDVAWWAPLAALVITWVSGLDYARVAPGLLRSRAPA